MVTVLDTNNSRSLTLILDSLLYKLASTSLEYAKYARKIGLGASFSYTKHMTS